ncbi:MAG: NUDIX hydrolase [Candidatus Bathyarchaeota archaeon]|nr:NUDIX hydrolase [Candidatus Bathyarchaeota archaeon]
MPGVAATVIHDDKILLCVRGNLPSAGKWGLPGGVVELGETLEEAVVREVMEETSVHVKPVKLLTLFNSIRKDESGGVKYHYVLFEYLCEYVSGEVKARSDAPDARWVALDNLDGVDLMRSTKAFILRLLDSDFTPF